MAIQVSPGVYASEKDFSAYVPQVSTTIFGVVGTASKGPVNEVTLITDEASLVRTFGYPSATHLGLYAALRYLKKGRALKFVRVANYDVKASIPLLNALGATAGEAQALTSGSWANGLQVKVEASTYFAGAYKIQVIDNSVVVETFDNCVLALPSSDNYWVTKINASSSYITITNVDDTKTDLAAATYTLAGGDDGAPADYTDYVGAVGTPPAVPATGLKLFSNAETIDVNILACPGISDKAVISELLSICESRGDCFALIDPPYGMTVQQVVDWHNGLGSGDRDPDTALSSSYAAVYWPWIQEYDGYNDADVWTPPSGHVAMVMAFTDQVADPWWAPAGLSRAILSHALSIEHSATQGERDFMYANGNAVNPICSFNAQGTVIWGQRTLKRTHSSTDRINVRRMVLYLRKVIARAAIQLVFEPGDEITYRSLVNLIEPTLESVRARRGITDFRVICDSTTNTPDVIDRGEIRGNVLIKPTKTAEVINIQFTLLSSGAVFEEV